VTREQTNPAEQTMAGVVVKAAGHRFVISTAKLIAAATLVGGIAWNAAAAQAQAFVARVEKLEESDRQKTKQIEVHDRRIEAQDATQARILADTTEIKARLAEVQVTLMREGRRIP
jgi:hypothetical protein